jgi:spore coat polysaccharide biosynthesis protein SpsF (cytidylyltransferase family)
MKITDNQLIMMQKSNYDYLTTDFTITIMANEIIRLRKLESICRALLEYRRHNTLNFQLEKIDDYFREIELSIAE